VRFAFIQAQRRTWPVKVMCCVLQVTRSGFYAWRRRRPGVRQRRREVLGHKIRLVHEQHRRVYGSPRVHQVLRGQGEPVCVNTVAKLMREQRIRAKNKPRFTPRTTDSRHDQPVAPNRLDRRFTAARPDRKWVADITYVRTDEGWLYVAAVLDLCTRRIVGWSMADHLRSALVSDALRMALDRRGLNVAASDPSGGEGLLHHSDRGVQYASDAYQVLLARHGITCSMSAKGNCYDNAAMESFWATLKTELVHHQRYATREKAKASIFEYIEVFYNRQRLHSALGYQSPETFEARLN
jgi:transposase InsO family protein